MPRVHLLTFQAGPSTERKSKQSLSAARPLSNGDLNTLARLGTFPCDQLEQVENGHQSWGVLLSSLILSVGQFRFFFVSFPGSADVLGGPVWDFEAFLHPFFSLLHRSAVLKKLPAFRPILATNRVPRVAVSAACA